MPLPRRVVPVLLAALVSLLPGRGADPEQSEEKAEAALKPLLAQPGSSAEAVKLRQELLTLRQTYPGTRAAVRAAACLHDLPSPLDKLDPKKIPELDVFTWQPKELVAVLGEHRGRHAYGVTAVVVTPDGKTVISGGAHGIRTFDAVKLRQRAWFGGGVGGLALTRDGRTLAGAGYDAKVHLYDMTANPPNLTASLPAGSAQQYAVAFSPNGKMVAAGGQDNVVRVWDLPPPADGKPRISIGIHTKPVAALLFAPDNKTLISGSNDESVRTWDVSGDVARDRLVIPGHGGGAASLALAGEGKVLAVGCDNGTIRLWALGTEKAGERGTLKDLGGRVYSLTFSDTGHTIASAGADWNARLSDVAGAKKPEILQGHINPVTAVAYGPKNHWLVTGSSDGTVRVWDLVGGKPKQRYEVRGHLSTPNSIAFAPDGTSLASGGDDRTARTWTLTGVEPKERSLFKENIPIYAVAYAPDGRTLAAGGAGSKVRLYDPVLGRDRGTLKDLPHPQVAHLMFSPLGRQLLITGYKDVLLWDLERGRELRRFDGQKSYVNSAAFAPGGRYFLTGGGTYLTKDGQVVTDKYGKYLYVDCTTRLWDVERNEPLAEWKAHETPVNAVAFTADGTQALACSAEMAVRRWTVGPTPAEAPSAPTWAVGGVRRLVPSPDGRLLATFGPDHSVVVWELATGKRLHQWNLPEQLGGLAFAPDSRHLALSIATGPVYVLRLARAKE
jgi:WD40 repeat protein